MTTPTDPHEPATSPKVVLVTGASTFVGGYLVRRLARRPDIERVIAVDAVPPTKVMRRRMEPAEFIRVDYRSHVFGKLMATNEVDTVVHAATSVADNHFPSTATKDAIVFGSMRVFAACQKSEAVRRVIMRSSAQVYGSRAAAPALVTEDLVSSPVVSGHPRDLLDAEAYARSMARRRTDLALTVLRLAPILGPNIETLIGSLFDRPFVPSIVGRDARLQLLHEEDALGSLEHAVVAGTTGTFTVAAADSMSMSQALRLSGRIPLPVVRSTFGPTMSAIRGRSGGTRDNQALLDYLSYGNAYETQRMTQVLGYVPKFTTRQAVEDTTRSGRSEPTIGVDSILAVEQRVAALAKRFAGIER